MTTRPTKGAWWNDLNTRRRADEGRGPPPPARTPPGGTALAVSPHSRARVVASLSALRRLDHPYDSRLHRIGQVRPGVYDSRQIGVPGRVQWSSRYLSPGPCPRKAPQRPAAVQPASRDDESGPPIRLPFERRQISDQSSSSPGEQNHARDSQ